MEPCTVTLPPYIIGLSISIIYLLISPSVNILYHASVNILYPVSVIILPCICKYILRCISKYPLICFCKYLLLCICKYPLVLSLTSKLIMSLTLFLVSFIFSRVQHSLVNLFSHCPSHSMTFGNKLKHLHNVPVRLIFHRHASPGKP